MATSPSHHVSVRFSPEDLAQVRATARALGLSVSAYIRAVSLGDRPRARPDRITREAIHQLARVGNNLNQLARWANAHGELPAGRELQDVLARLRRKIQEIA